MHATSQPRPAIPRAIQLADVRDWTLLTALAILGPYVAHLLPSWDDTPIGARLIPVFYAPLLGVFWRQHGFTLALALASPWINHLLFQRPALPVAVVLSFELIVFTALLLVLTHRWGRRAWMGAAGYLLTKPFSAALLAIVPLPLPPPLRFVAGSVTTAWPGIVVLLLLGWLASREPHRPAT